jgi:Clr5 domain
MVVLITCRSSVVPPSRTQLCLVRMTAQATLMGASLQYSSPRVPIFDNWDRNFSNPWQNGAQQCQNLDILGGNFDPLAEFFDPAQWNPPDLAYRPREPSVIVRPEPRHPSREEWERIRPIFTKLYITENRTLEDVRSILEKQYGFVAKYLPSTSCFSLTLLTWLQPTHLQDPDQDLGPPQIPDQGKESRIR